MIDNHISFEHWGVKPILFRISGFEVPTYSFFVLLGLIVGFIIHFYEAKRKHELSENGLYIAFGSFAGGIIGSKLLQWLIDLKHVFSYPVFFSLLFSGKTIVGGLIGGIIGVKITKKYLKIKNKMGNLLAMAVAMGVAIGRLGCFFQGCCFGKPTSLPWGVNFGDNIHRHPTQLYESLFMLIMFGYLEKIKDRQDIKPGELFNKLLLVYFSFRFLIEFIRVNEVVFGGLTTFQIISMIAIIYLERQRVVSWYIKNK